MKPSIQKIDPDFQRKNSRLIEPRGTLQLLATTPSLNFQNVRTPKCELSELKMIADSPPVPKQLITPKPDQHGYIVFKQRPALVELPQQQQPMQPQQIPPPQHQQLHRTSPHVEHHISQHPMLLQHSFGRSSKLFLNCSQPVIQQQVGVVVPPNNFFTQGTEPGLVKAIPPLANEVLSPQAMAKMNDCARFNELFRSIGGKIPFSMIYFFTSGKQVKKSILEDWHVRSFYETLLSEYKYTLDENSHFKQVRYNAIEQKKILLPKKRPTLTNKTLVFDLDETLIHNKEYGHDGVDAVVTARYPEKECSLRVNIRPYAREILQELSQFFEIVVFTASFSYYANPIMDHLDPNGDLIDHRLFREHCIQTENGTYVKDLRILSNRSLENLVLIDNCAPSFITHIENGIPVMPFFDNKNDSELKHLMDFLLTLAHVPDVRIPLSKTFKLAFHNQVATPADWMNHFIEKF
eukprot:TRINITY_DN4519_c0_g2_i6.p1 TRINITY_DN4519_c0_g2~~TRINITY_DN4519_c0_g2_i6.p1  ORF type:complete len:464 (+),score=90.28 TRINITY_DN4519_c0_g2_i6:1018-2409(+)